MNLAMEQDLLAKMRGGDAAAYLRSTPAGLAKDLSMATGIRHTLDSRILIFH